MTGLNLIKKSLSIFLLMVSILTISNGLAQEKRINDTAQSGHDSINVAFTKMFGLNLVKISPALNNWNIKGIVISYETGIGRKWATLLTSVKYYAGSKATNTIEVDIPEHYRIELQPRFWPVKPFDGIFLGPLFNYSFPKGSFGVGGLLGYQKIIAKRISIEAFLAFQNSTNTENYDAPLFLRLGLNIGFVFPKFE
jgi:hypothetical protein